MSTSRAPTRASPPAVVASAGTPTARVVTRGPQGGVGFPKSVRLLAPRQFRLVQGGSGRRASGALLAVAVRVTEEGVATGSARFGLAISKKVGNAVARNHVKRRVREAARHLRASLPAVDVVVSGKPGAAAANGAQLRDELVQLLRRAGVRWSEDDRTLGGSS